ncbi:MAG TPA: GIY-YIG nuclease family protein [Acidobacteriaceae bacterium]
MTERTASPKTIQIFLPDGDPRGLRVAEITTRIVRVVEVPRDRLDQFLLLPEAVQVALYFLFGNDPEGASDQLYIGQTGGCGVRLSQHKDKVFWDRALVVVSLTNSLTQTHASFLEWLAIKEAKDIGRYAVQNGNSGSKPHTPAPLTADCLEIFETAGILLATLGYPAFEPILKHPVHHKSSNELFCEASGAKGRGVYTDEGFVVLKGSTGRAESVPSIKGTSDGKFRQRLIEQGVMRVEGDRVVFDKDHLFRSPSTAAVALTGRTANGWIEWKNGGGETLRALRQPTTDRVGDIEAH